MKNKTFLQFLQEKFDKENPQILDDDLSDAFNDWDIEFDDMVSFADEYVAEVLTSEKERFKGIIKTWLNSLWKKNDDKGME